jgi:hypothetical protein
MEYKGFLIPHDKVCRRWIVKVDFYTEWLAIDEQDAKRQIDEYLSRNERRIAA